MKTKFRILSPDGFDISRNRLYNKEEVLPAVQDFVSRFEEQGYYSSPRHGRIPLDQIESYMEVIIAP